MSRGLGDVYKRQGLHYPGKRFLTMYGIMIILEMPEQLILMLKSFEASWEKKASTSRQSGEWVINSK